MHKLISVQSWRRQVVMIIVLLETHTCTPHSILNVLSFKIHVIVVWLCCMLILNTNYCNKNVLVTTAYGNLDYYKNILMIRMDIAVIKNIITLTT